MARFDGIGSDGDPRDGTDDADEVADPENDEKACLRKKRLVGLIIVFLLIGVWAISWITFAFG